MERNPKFDISPEHSSSRSPDTRFLLQPQDGTTSSVSTHQDSSVQDTQKVPPQNVEPTQPKREKQEDRESKDSPAISKPKSRSGIWGWVRKKKPKPNPKAQENTNVPNPETESSSKSIRLKEDSTQQDKEPTDSKSIMETPKPQEIDELNNPLQKQEQEIGNIESANTDLEHQLPLDIEHITKDKEDFQNKPEMEVLKAAENDKLNSLLQRIDNLEKDKEELKHQLLELEPLKDANKDLRNDLEQYQLEVQYLEKYNTELQNQIKEKDLILKSQENLIYKLKKDNTSSKYQLADKLQEVEGLRRELFHERKKAKDELESYTQSRQLLKKMQELLIQEIDDLKAESRISNQCQDNLIQWFVKDEWFTKQQKSALYQYTRDQKQVDRAIRRWNLSTDSDTASDTNEHSDQQFPNKENRSGTATSSGGSPLFRAQTCRIWEYIHRIYHTAVRRSVDPPEQRDSQKDTEINLSDDELNGMGRYTNLFD
jgi:hypothetical protein